MVSSDSRLSMRLGSLMIWGSLAGVLISCLSVVLLVFYGHPLRPWLLSLHGWWGGPGPLVLEVLSGAGIILLTLTPVFMLLVFGIQAARQKRLRTVLVALGLVLVLSGGLLLALSGQG